MNSPSRNYLTSIVAGIVAALVACAIYIAGMIGIGLGLPLLRARFGNEGAGVGAVVLDSGTVLAIAVVAFAFGAFWKFRRRSGRRITH